MSITCTASYIVGYDTSSASSGNLMVNVELSALAAGESVFMYEYVIYPNYITQNPPSDPVNITAQGFIPIESVQQPGNNNLSANVPIPCIGQGVIANPPQFQVRAYLNDMTVSPWSNTLLLYQAPNQPSIIAAIYDTGSSSYGPATLYVQIQDPSGDAVNHYIISYYSVVQGGASAWSVSPVLTSSAVPGGGAGRMVQVAMANNITNVTPVYVAVNGVALLNDGDYFTLGSVSDTVLASQAVHDAPDLYDFPWNDSSPNSTYDVYDTNAQTITLNWVAPTSSFLAPFAVSYYMVERSLNGGSTWSARSSVNTVFGTTYTDSLSGLTCGATMQYRVYAVSTGAIQSPYSNVIGANYYSFPLIPASASGTCNVGSGGVIAFTGGFTNPSSIGCGSNAYLYWSVTDDVNNVLLSGSVPYHITPSSYTVAGTFTYSAGAIYSINVYVTTADTNTENVYSGPIRTNQLTLATTVPVISNLAYGSNSISCIIVSQTTQVQSVGTLGWVSTVGSIMRYFPFSMTPYTGVPSQGGTLWTYTVNFDPATIVGPGVFNASAIQLSVSNAAGVGSSIVSNS